MSAARIPPSSARRRADATRGFTLVEAVTVAALLGTLARIAVPDVHEAVVRARAAEVVAAMRAVHLAVAGYQADRHAWPADSYAGHVPEGLAPYLPEGFDFDGQGYRLDWEVWALPEGLPGEPGTELLLGVSVVTEDRELALAVAGLLGRAVRFYALGDRYTFIIERA